MLVKAFVVRLTPGAAPAEMNNRRSSNGFTALSAVDDEQPDAEQDSEEEGQQDDGDLVAAEQHKYVGAALNRASSPFRTSGNGHTQLHKSGVWILASSMPLHAQLFLASHALAMVYNSALKSPVAVRCTLVAAN